MSPRPRKKRNNALPVNLYTANAGKTFRYKHPVSGKFFGMGSDKPKAIAAAKHLNSLLVQSEDLVSNVLGYVSVADHIEWMRQNIIPERDYSKSTLSLNETRYRNLISEFGSKNIAEITVQDVAQLIEDKTPRVANQIRQIAVDVFNIAISRGLCADNPAESTLKRKQKTERERLTAEQFLAVLENSPVWLQNAMNLAYLTLQRRSDIASLKFSDAQDGYLYVKQQKTQKYDSGYVKIQLSPTLEKLINSCKDSTISPFIIHRKPSRIMKRENVEHWTQINPQMISREFKKVRDRLKEFEKIPMSKRPTFHEIRALGIKHMKDAGENPQALAGHASEEMTKNYDSGHDSIRWVEAKSTLDLICKTTL